MASALGMGKKTSPEEIIERQGGKSKKAEPGQQVRVVGGVTGSGLYNPQHSGLNTQTLMPDDDGIIRADNGAYKWDERLQRYSAIPGQGRGYLLVDPVQQQSDEVKSSGGGKGGSAKPSASADKPGYIEERAGSPGLTTEQMMGNTYNQMMDWRPTASNGAGGVQGMNPLVDPNKFIYQADPAQQQTRDIGRYVNPNIQPQGLLVATPNFKKSKNPYSLLG